MSKKVIYDTVGIDMRVKSGKDAKKKTEPLSVEGAKELLGWVDEEQATKAMGSEVKFQNEYTLRDFHSVKVRCHNNPSNRPYRAGLTKKYANEMVRGKWRLNGETIIIDKFGFVQSGQHRLAGLVVAEQMRKADPERWKPYWKGPVNIDALICTGISAANDVVDTIDIGQKRSLGDVLYRNRGFADKAGDISDRDQKRLSNILAHATRLVWLRCGGMTVSDAPNFPHSEALDFIEAHPGLLTAATFVYNEDGTGAEGKKISSYISLGYASALLYMLGTSSTDPLKFRDTGETDLGNWDKAEQFWVEFGAGEKELAPLKNALVKIDSSGSAGRDEIVGTVVKTMNLWMDKTKIDGKSIKMKKTLDKKTQKHILGENPRLGGVDTQPPEKEKKATRPSVKGKKDSKKDGKKDASSTAATPATSTKKKATKKRTDPRAAKGGKKKKDAKKDTAQHIFSKGDLVTVKDEAGDWKGTYVKKDPNEDIHYVAAADDDGEYEVAIDKIVSREK